MIKVKDGYAKLVGTTASGSASHILLSNGGVKAVSDFAMADGTNATGTWSIDISGNAKSSTLSLYLLTGVGSECDANTLAFSDHLLRWYSSVPSTSSNIPTSTGWLNGILALPLHSNGITAQLYFSYSKALFYRSSASGDWNQIAFTDLIPTVTNYYWANVPVSSTSSTTTHPTFGNVSIKGGDDSGLNLHTNAGYTRIRFYNASSVNNATIHYFGTAYSGYDFAKDTLNVLGGSATTIGSWNNPTMYITSNSTTSDNSGKVGIGTTAPNAKLHVNGHTLINKRLTIGLDLGNWDSSRAELELISPSGQANDFWLGSGLRDWSITSRPAAENNTLNFHAHISSTTTPLVMVLEKSGNTTIYGNLQIGKSDTRNYIAFRGTTGDNPGSFNHTYIGENLWGGSESSELILYKGNDIGATATTVDVSGADRIRHIAGGHLFQIYKSALSGTFETICASTVPVNMLAIHLNSIQTYAPLVIVGEKYSGNYGINMQNSDIVGINALYTLDNAEDGGEGLQFSRGNGYYDSIWASGGVLYFSPNGNLNRSGSYSNNYTVLHTGNYTGTLDGRYVNVTGDTMTGNLTVPSLNSYYLFKTTDIAEGAANLGTLATAHTITFFRNGIMIPYKMDNANDGGMIRTKGASEDSCVFEMATWDDSGAGETIQLNYYSTTSQLTPTYSNIVPKVSGTLLNSGNWSSYIGGHGYVMQEYTIDATGLDLNTWYPVTMTIGASPNVRIEIRVSLNSGSKPSWSTHSSGFAVRKIWEVNGSGWGTNTVHRTVFISDYAHASTDPVRGMGDMGLSSTEYVYVRGGGRYYFYTSHNVIPYLRTSTYVGTADPYYQAISPTTTAPGTIAGFLINRAMYASHFYENSDAKLKENINLISNSDNIPLLKEFDWKSDGKHSYGLIAQELEAMGYSELVEDSGDHKTVNYSAALSLIVGKLLVKIQEIEKENKELRDEINNLKTNKLWQS